MGNEPPVTILTVEDEASVRRSITAYLEDRGFTVLEAGDGRWGLEVFEQQRPDLVLVDLRMPEMDGLEVLPIIRREAPDTPVVVISGAGVLDDAVQALRLGAWDYLVKPIPDMSVLEHAVRRCLERARLLEENRRYREYLESEVQRRTAELDAANDLLARKNTALEEVLATIQEQRKRLEQNVVGSVEKTILPMLDSLRRALPASQEKLVAEIERSLRQITSPFIARLTRQAASLTPTEVRLCALLRRGLSSKEIARLEHVSLGTVNVHRRSIRRKLGVRHKKINLAVFLNTLDME